MIIQNYQTLTTALGQASISSQISSVAVENSSNNLEDNDFGEAKSISNDYDVRNISPREVATMSSDLYQSGKITLKQHALLSFQPELNSEYDSTLGAMTGTTAQPDQKRDYIEVWEQKLEDEMKLGASSDQIKDTQEVLNILKNLDALKDYVG